MGNLIKGWKVMLLTKDGHESGKAPEVVGWQSTNEPDIRDGVNGLDTHGVPLNIIHSFSIEAVKAE
ncbi:TPA: hypothetical protein G8K00_001817 [Salmonella enterica]|uniref:Uncharacterized protein n=1 Tax=Salmonella enterica TaxID=28901 RepID=A0A744Z3N8_SALER|nr:hypothetical protein [Salmonella enterica subsp. enterica serovar Ruiru]EEQ1217695.1 hypothetical protein [Salmonella enterica]EDU5621060.1 hypothetical protein [Salmonella enterica subsp. enterica serovar Ruiru]EHN5646360.1 hypothetical protein [Salmonella enterica]EHN5666882.1 hypothetical protein [Salmonella enterica]